MVMRRGRKNATAVVAKMLPQWQRGFVVVMVRRGEDKKVTTQS
jgi:hypothetical protein